MRTVTLVTIAAFVLLGLVGCFGVTSRTITVTSPGGMAVEVTYPQRTRPALATHIAIEVRRPDGFDSAVEVQVNTDYLESFDENGLNPDPESATTDGSTTTWTFEQPEADTFTVWLDTRIEPGVQWRRDGVVRVAVGDDEAEVAFRTWIMP